MLAKFFWVLSLIIFLNVFAIPAPAVLALKQVSFPDSAKLQPIPKNVATAVSGNVNKSYDVFVDDKMPAEDSPVEENNPSLYVEQNNTGGASFSWGFVFAIILGLIILFSGVAVFIYNYKKSESKT